MADAPLTIRIAGPTAIELLEAMTAVAAGHTPRIAAPGKFIVSREAGEMVIQILNLSAPEPAT